MEQNIKFDFGWGNPYFLLEILKNRYNQKLSPHNIGEMSYAEDEGRPELIELIRKTIKQQTGLEYKYIVVTTGATQAINICLRVMANDPTGERARHTVITNKYGYPFYDDMIKKAGYFRKTLGNQSLFEEPVYLIDSPSNPLGTIRGGSYGRYTIWDAVYHNKIYSRVLNLAPEHMVMVNSFSKTLGLTGARIGYIATNYQSLYEKCTHECLMENATISVPSQELIIDILKTVDLDAFMDTGAYMLDGNRDEFSKISYLFDNQPVQQVGMFYCANADKKAVKILDNCGIKYVRLDDDMIRLSMGQTNTITKNGIKAILKEDGK